MRSAWQSLTLISTLAVIGGCSDLFVVRSPYLSYTEEYGVAGEKRTTEGTAAAGTGAEIEFRRDSTITLRNNHPDAELNTLLVAWVNVSSVRSAEQQDALLRAGYKQLSQEIRLGTAHVLPIGTYVYDGGGTAGATTVFLGPARQLGTAATGEQGAQQAGERGTSTAAAPTTRLLTLPTPDVVLVFVQPPVSCESVAFYYTINGEPLPAKASGPDAVSPYAGSTGTGGYKTLAQVDVYECSPLRPGVFFSQGGTQRKPNEFYEGESITFDFFDQVRDGGYFCTVSFGATAGSAAGGAAPATP